MAVKFIRLSLVAVVLIMSVANVLFIVENWNLNNAGKPKELRNDETRQARTVASTNKVSSSLETEGEYLQFNNLIYFWATSKH